MEELHIHTENINEINNNIIKVINEFRELLDVTFELIEKMPNVTGEWIGLSAERFVILANADSENYYLLKNNLSDFSNYLIKYCAEMESVMKQVTR